MSPVSEYYSVFEYHSVFDELHHIFADTRNDTKHAGYDGIAKSRHCVQGIVVKKCILVKNPDTSWVDRNRKVLSLYGLGLPLPCSLARQQ